MQRRAPLQRKTPLRTGGVRLSGGSSATPMRQATLQRAAIKRRAPKKRPGYHDPKYLAACKGECCYLRFPGCRSYPEDPTVVPAHQNEGKGMGLKVHDKFTVPACFHCHALYDQSGIDREIKRATFDWAYTRWVPVRAGKLGLQHVETL
ncbi:Protein of uncharacterised function (DUF1364) [Bordetella pertussis]|uniref:DUF1364 family protein n=1 Tax=Bordetella pertussis (strain ATCC 9797 / DSM 5571 / CCUG 30873 / LMG 14455 / NCTC 10739 / 18323) TaxID=568706 RepID=A0A0T7CJC8_BORP1|nr:DUF1364 family protein [Bordetella pertussis]AZR83414.1 hypothetical protein BBB37_00660 [Bordetella pertussis]PNO99487.1 hypothetical protein AL465_012390 [Bordetella pertussis 18323]UEB56850.1 DUF1364 family protein [Bordetella pertussis]CCJ61553.1 phage-related conserved hypothetical protein [Bordetella pertussis 18323]CFP44540.1 Protein of uncharacterised function (DUF1364) [Bordetella pertussis]